ncbi:MAG: hypothetical protein HYX79_04915 [Chloroflexi bacterium]|nr:hypothetical protein [Chloroflexota bacterium]
MRGLRNCLVALLFGISAPALIWVGAGAALYQKRKAAKKESPVFACSIDEDCPPGFVCFKGRCVLAE